MRQRWPDPAERRIALDHALAERGPLDPLAAGTGERVTAWLADAAVTPAPHWTEIDLRSDDPDDLTLRELRWLGAADLILHDPQVPPAILDRARADAARSPLTPGLGVVAHPGNVVVIRRG
jgi:uroporphyrin-III C-methyltransferase/precorrin-2 dehydrogenase/sirohydrochlorin ferrochelatase